MEHSTWTDSCNYFIIKLIILLETITRINPAVSITVHTLCSDCQWLTLLPLLTPTVDSTYCDVVFVTCHKTSQFILCNTDISDVHKSSIWDMRSIGGNVDEVEVCTVSTTQCPVHSDIHSFTDISWDANTVYGEDRGATCRVELHDCQIKWMIGCPTYNEVVITIY